MQARHSGVVGSLITHILYLIQPAQRALAAGKDAEPFTNMTLCKHGRQMQSCFGTPSP